MMKTELSEAIKSLQEGGLIIYPTDTLYALGADIYNTTAVRSVFKVKKRPFSVPLPVAVSSLQEMESIVHIDTAVKKLSERFLPGSLTMIVKKKPSVPDLVTSNQDTVAVRIPKDPIALQLLSAYGPLTVTSANIHNEKTYSDIPHILKQLGVSIPVCLNDGKRTQAASTIVDLTTQKPIIRRHGTLSEKEILDVIRNERPPLSKL